jgi:hypothetical protein
MMLHMTDLPESKAAFSVLIIFSQGKCTMYLSSLSPIWPILKVYSHFSESTSELSPSPAMELCDVAPRRTLNTEKEAGARESSLVQEKAPV